LQQFGIFGRASFSNFANHQDRLRSSSDSVARIQKKARRDPDGLSRLIKAATQVETQSLTFISDLETTGVIADQYGPHKPVALGLIAYRQSMVETSAEYIINPARPCNTYAIKKHGFRSEDLSSRKTFEETFPNYLRILANEPNAVLWFHNAPVDKRRIIAALKDSQSSYVSDFEAIEICCSYSLALTIRPKKKNHNTLNQLCKYYGISIESRKNGHGALIDSYILLKVLKKLSEDVLDKAQKAKILDEMLELSEELPKPSTASCKK